MTKADQISHIKNVNENVLPYITIIVEDKVVDAFIDTGASLTFINEELRQNIALLSKRPMQKPSGVTISVTREVVDRVGSFNVNLMFGTKRIVHNIQVLVARGIDKDFIIGWDFMIKHSVVLDLERGYFEMYGKQYLLVKPQMNVPLCSDVVAQVSYNLPARSESLVLARISTPDHCVIPDGFCGILEPICMSETNFLLARSITKVENGFIEIQGSTILGHFHAISNDGCEYEILEPESSGLNSVSGMLAKSSESDPL